MVAWIGALSAPASFSLAGDLGLAAGAFVGGGPCFFSEACGAAFFFGASFFTAAFGVGLAGCAFAGVLVRWRSFVVFFEVAAFFAGAFLTGFGVALGLVAGLFLGAFTTAFFLRDALFLAVGRDGPALAVRFGVGFVRAGRARAFFLGAALVAVPFPVAVLFLAMAPFWPAAAFPFWADRSGDAFAFFADRFGAVVFFFAMGKSKDRVRGKGKQIPLPRK
jgi:hypothetical protein